MELQKLNGPRPDQTINEVPVQTPYLSGAVHIPYTTNPVYTSYVTIPVHSSYVWLSSSYSLLLDAPLQTP